MKLAAGYLRVSTSRKIEAVNALNAPFLQNPKVQLEPLLKLISARGWELGEVYEDRMSGACTSRPAYKRLLEDARRGKFQVVVVWRFDRFARSTKELLGALEEFRTLGIDFFSHQEAIDTSTPAGKMMFTMIAAVAEFERDIIRERILAGLEYAKEHGTKSGKPIGGQPKIFRRDELIRFYQQGYSYRQIADWLHVGLGTVARTVALYLAKERSVNPIGESGDTVRLGRV